MHALLLTGGKIWESCAQRRWNCLVDQWLFLVPQLAVYTTYILPSGGLYATYHPLREPETTIDWWTDFPLVANASWYRKIWKLIDTFSTIKTAMEVIQGESNVLVEVLRQKPSKVQSFWNQSFMGEFLVQVQRICRNNKKKTKNGATEDGTPFCWPWCSYLFEVLWGCALYTTVRI